MEELVLTKPAIELVIRETDWSYWKQIFERWHYLKAVPMPFSTAYVGFVGEEPVCHLGMSGMVAGKRRVARACRMVVLPEWMGAGIGTAFLDWAAERELRGEGFIGERVPTIFHTNHPGLCFVLRRSKKWRQVSTHLVGGEQRKGRGLAWGTHLRGVQGFRYYGAAGVEAATESSNASAAAAIASRSATVSV